MRFVDLCLKFGDDDECFVGEGPLTFITDEDGNVEIPQTNSKLLEKIQSGTGGPFQGNGSIVEVSTKFGGSTPAEVTQDQDSGENNIKSAKAVKLGYPYKLNNFTKN